MAYSKEDKDNFIQILIKNNLNVSKACKSFKISRSTYQDWIKDKTFADLVLEAEQSEIDDAEDQLRMQRKGVPKYKLDNKGDRAVDSSGNHIIIDWLIKPDAKSIHFFLERKAKDRGYGRTQEITGIEIPKMPEVVIGLKIHKPKKDGSE